MLAAARFWCLAPLVDKPPAFIAVGALDLFVDEDIEYAARLVRAGVATTLHVYPGAYHGFDANGGARVARRFAEDYRAAAIAALNLSAG